MHFFCVKWSQCLVWEETATLSLGGRRNEYFSNRGNTGKCHRRNADTILLFAFMYFFMIRPQQKETKKKNQMLSELAIGDTVLTTSGFYGTIIDIDEDTLIVEFGNNRNCRIPMQRAAVSEVEKPEDAVESK